MQPAHHPCQCVAGCSACVARRGCSTNWTQQDADKHRRLVESVQREQPTEWILVKRDADGRWQLMGDDNTQQSADVHRVEVLRDIDWYYLDGEVVHNVEVQCRLVLQACPYLEHLHLFVEEDVCEAPSHAGTFALVPRFRSLHVEICEFLSKQEEEEDDRDRDEEKPLFDCRAMLNSLPHLTSLTCTHILDFGVSQLLDIASHSTLEEVCIISIVCAPLSLALSPASAAVRCVWRWLTSCTGGYGATGCALMFSTSHPELSPSDTP